MSIRLAQGSRGERLDRAIARAIGGSVSVREVRRALVDGRILVDGRPARPGRTATGDEVIDADAFVPRAEARVAPDPELLGRCAVLHDGDELLVLDKPSGVASQPLSHDEPGTMLGAAVAADPRIEVVGPPLEGGLLHRLDAGTSGALAFARTAAARERLRRAFSTGGVKKSYLAVVHDPQSRLQEPVIVRVPLAGRGSRVRAGEGRDALPATSDVRPVRRRGAVLLVQVEARTGRRHQVRAHLAHLGTPVLGDAIYGDPSAGPALRRREVGGFALHASGLRFAGGPIVDAPLPADLEELL